MAPINAAYLIKLIHFKIILFEDVEDEDDNKK